MNKNVLFLSIRPQYVARILDGSKTVELRRVRPNVDSGQSALIYSSSPTMAVLAVATIERIESSEPAELWPHVRHAAGVSKAEYDDYFYAASRAVAIWIRNVTPLLHPVSLAELRERWPWFRPPQSYRYVSAELKHQRLHDLALPF